VAIYLVVIAVVVACAATALADNNKITAIFLRIISTTTSIQ
jgi:hypothetical protein